MYPFYPIFFYIFRDLSQNGLTALAEDTFKNLPNLQNLKLSHNSLTDINPKTFQFQKKSLISLNLSHNKLKKMFDVPRKDSLPALRILILNSNSISSISDRVFQYLPNLETL